LILKQEQEKRHKRETHTQEKEHKTRYHDSRLKVQEQVSKQAQTDRQADEIMYTEFIKNK